MPRHADSCARVIAKSCASVAYDEFGLTVCIALIQCRPREGGPEAGFGVVIFRADDPSVPALCALVTSLPHFAAAILASVDFCFCPR